MDRVDPIIPGNRLMCLDAVRSSVENLKRADLCRALVLFLALFCAPATAAYAHTPHDRIVVLALSPEYEQDRTLFVIVRQNLLQSTDGGLSWKRLVRGIDNKHDLSSLAISRSSRNTLFLASRGDGIYRSRDGGSSWRKINTGLSNLDVPMVAISPSSPELAFAVGAGKELYRTMNGGDSWELVFRSPNQPSAVTFFSDKQGHILVGDAQGALYESRDSGKTWSTLFTFQGAGAIRAIAILPPSSSDRIFLVGTEKAGVFRTTDGGTSFAPANQGLNDRSITSIAVSAGTANGSGVFATTWNDGVFYSNNGGESWTEQNNGVTKDHQADDFQESHFYGLGVSTSFAQDKTIFLGAFAGLFRSQDGGVTWAETDVLPSNLIVGLSISPDYETDMSVAISEYFGGVYLSKDKGANWAHFSRSLKGRCDPKFFPRFRVFGVEFSPNYGTDRTLFTAAWWGILQSTAGGRTWDGASIQEMTRTPLPQPKIALSPEFLTDRIIYAGTRYGEFFRSSDGGKRFAKIAEFDDGIRSLVLSPEFSSDRTIVYVWDGGVQKSTDAGKTWASADSGISLGKQSDIKLVISPNFRNDKTIYAGSRNGLFVTSNGGNSWERIEGAAFGDAGYILGVVISPDYRVDETLIVNVKGHGLFKTENAGKSFTAIGAGLLQNNISLSGTNPFSEQHPPIQFSPNYSNDNTVFGYSGTHVYRSEDGGDTWNEFTPPKPDYGIGRFIHCAAAESGKRSFVTAAAAGLLGYFLVGFVLFRRLSVFHGWLVRGLGATLIFGVVLAGLSI